MWVGTEKSNRDRYYNRRKLADALCHGASFKPGVLQGGMKADNWTLQQLFGLDFDNGMCIEEAYNKVISLGIVPCFMYTTFSHKEEHHKFRMIFCNDTVITDGSIRDKLQATLMGAVGWIDEVCFNRDRLFFGGKGNEVLYPSYDSKINAEAVIDKYWKDEYEQYISNAQPKSKKKPAAKKEKSNTVTILPTSLLQKMEYRSIDVVLKILLLT